MKTKWIIKDWCNNVCFQGSEFNSFEEAWEWIYQKDPAPEDEDESGHYSDYEVVEKES